MPNTLPFAIGSVVTPHSVIQYRPKGYYQGEYQIERNWMSGEPLVVVKPYPLSGTYILRDRFDNVTTAQDSELRPL